METAFGAHDFSIRGFTRFGREAWHNQPVKNRISSFTQHARFCRPGTPALRWFLVLLMCLPGMAVDLSEARAQPPGPGLIVRFQSEGPHALLESAEQLFETGEAFTDRTADQSASLDQLHQQFRVEGIRALFRDNGPTSLQGQRSRMRARLARNNPRRSSHVPRLPDVTHIYRVQLPEGSDPEQVMSAYAEDPHVAWVQQDHTHALDALTNDPYLFSSGSWGQDFSDLWSLYRIRAPEAWELSTGQGVVVAVVDTGVDYDHPDIAANIWVNPGEDLNRNGQVDPSDWNGVDDDGNGFIDDLRGFDFAGSVDEDGDGLYDGPLDVSDPDPFDDRGHGTHVAGTIAAVGNNGIGIVGVAPDARIMPLKGFPAEGDGLDSDLWRAVLYAAMNGADVINNSWSCRPLCPENPLAEEVLEIVQALNVVVVTSAGNAGIDAVINSPENRRETITVGASGFDDEISSGISNFGWVIDLMAPGGGPGTDPSVRVARRNILSLRSSGYTAADFVVDDLYLRWAGTSMAAPHVSGVVALLKSQRPELDYESIRRILRQTPADISAPGRDYQTGAGRLDARAALEWTDLPDLLARLDSPANWETFAPGEDILIEGAILGQDLESWSVEVGIGSAPTQWTTLHTDTQARDGVLVRWPTAELDQGAYVIRLSVQSNGGRTFLEFSQISLESNSFVRLSSPGQPATQPAISFPWVAWSSKRDPEQPMVYQEDKDLFVTHLRTGQEWTLQQAAGHQENVSISTHRKKTVVSWQDEALDGDRNEIRGCSFSSRRPDCSPFVVTDDPSAYPHSRAMGQYIVWLQTVEGRRDLVSCKVSRKRSGCEPASLGNDSGFNVSFPAGTGNTLIWSEVGNGYKFAFCEMNPRTGLCPRVELAERTLSLSRPSASGDLIAWVAYTRTGALSGPLRLCEVDRETGVCPWIEVDFDVPDPSPQLSGKRLVWASVEGDQAGDVYFCEYDSLRQVCPVQRLTAQMARQAHVRIDGRWIVWEDDRHGSTAIYGIELPRLKVSRIRRSREGKKTKIRLRARDPMGGPLKLRAEWADGGNLEDLGAEFVQTRDEEGLARGEFKWRPKRGQAGTYVVTFSAETASGIVTRESVEIDVKSRR